MMRACSDVICEYPLREMLDYHKTKEAEGTILVTQVLVSITALLAKHTISLWQTSENMADTVQVTCIKSGLISSLVSCSEIFQPSAARTELS